VRLPREADRDRFVELFGNEHFMCSTPENGLGGRGRLTACEAVDNLGGQVLDAAADLVPRRLSRNLDAAAGVTVAEV